MVQALNVAMLPWGMQKPCRIWLLSGRAFVYLSNFKRGVPLLKQAQ